MRRSSSCRRVVVVINACLTFLIAGCAAAKLPDYRIAVIPKGLTNEFWQSIHRGAESAAADILAAGGPHVRVIWDGPLRESDAIEEIRIVDRQIAARVDGIVLAPQHSQTLVPAVERAVAEGIPVVIVVRNISGSKVSSLMADNHGGAYQAVEHLAGLGHRRIAFLGGFPDTAVFTERMQGYRAAMEKAGLAVSDELVVGSAPSRTSIRVALEPRMRILPLLI